MKRLIKVGCSGFPVARAKYYKNFECIEINVTFYQLPRIETARKWRKEAPENFEFIIKAWQLITHPYGGPTYDRLFERISPLDAGNYGFFKPTKQVFAAWERTRQFASELGCGKVLFQSPARFKPSPENISNIRKFFGRINRTNKKLVFMWEPRGNWPENEIMSICREAGLVHCVDPNHDRPAYGAFNYFRLHGAWEGNKINYNYSFSGAELKKILKSCDKRLNYVMFNHREMFDNAVEFRKMTQNP